MKQSMVVHGYYSIPGKAEAGGPRVQGQHVLYEKTLSQTNKVKHLHLLHWLVYNLNTCTYCFILLHSSNILSMFQ